MFKEQKFVDFVQKMNLALLEKQNIYGDTWKTMNVDFLEQRLNAKIVEFKLTKNPEKLISISNLSMMLYVRKQNE